MARILIAGCGDVGALLGAVLAGAGHEAFGLRRDTTAIPDGIVPVAGDLARPESLSALPGPFEAVVYTATPGESSDAAYARTYVEGQRHLAHALERGCGLPERWIFTSSTSVYGQTGGEWVDEDSPTEPAGHAGRRMLEAEALVASLAARGVRHTVSVRFGGIYGEGRTWLVRRVRSGAPCTADPVLFTNRIHREDCAGVLAHLVALGAPATTYLGVDCDPAPQCEVMDWIAERLGVPRPGRVTGGSSRGSKRCRNARLLASGYRFRFPGFRDGYARLLT